MVIVVGLMLFHLYDLRKVLSAFFAKGLLHQASSAGQVGAGFALGGVVGALLYAVSRHRGRGAGWVLGGVAGTVLLALGWIPVNLPTMIVAVFLFGVTNVGARLVLTRWRQELTPLDQAGGVRAASEFGRTAMSVGVDSLVGGAFSAGFGAYGAFGIVAGMLVLFAAAQLAIARHLARIPTPDTLQALERRSRWLPRRVAAAMQMPMRWPRPAVVMRVGKGQHLLVRVATDIPPDGGSTCGGRGFRLATAQCLGHKGRASRPIFS